MMRLATSSSYIDKTMRLIKYKNFIVSPRKIEELLQRHWAVSDVVVISVSHTVDEQYPRAYVKKNRGAEV